MAVTEPVCSSNSVWYDENPNRSVTDEVESVKSNLADHTHTGYAAANHTHDYAAASHEHTNYALVEHTHDLTGKADLVNGKVPASQLPGYVDDVVEAHVVSGSTVFSAGWLSETAGGTALTPEAGKVYIVVTDGDYEGLTYRWSGSIYAPIGNDLALGETAATAHRGDHGKAAYDHSQNGTVHVTADQKTAWDSKAAGDHTHTAAALLAMASSLFFTNDSGGVEYFYGENSGKNLLTEMAAWPQGVHTAYSNGSNEGNPKDTESWRIFCHKTSGVIGWVLAFGTSGSIFSNYYDNGWKGWRAIYDALHAPLWTGEMYMAETHTIIPTKALSNCAHGWLLLWSDYNPGEGVGNTDFSTTMIPNFAYTGQKWNGGQFLCNVPRYADASGEATVVKTLQVFDAKLVGSAFNTVSPRNDVVLRAVYEF